MVSAVVSRPGPHLEGPETRAFVRAGFPEAGARFFLSASDSDNPSKAAGIHFHVQARRVVIHGDGLAGGKDPHRTVCGKRLRQRATDQIPKLTRAAGIAAAQVRRLAPGSRLRSGLISGLNLRPHSW
jgi:hypothetical protein